MTQKIRNKTRKKQLEHRMINLMKQYNEEEEEQEKAKIGRELLPLLEKLTKSFEADK